MNDPAVTRSPIARAVDVAINLGLVFLILIWCFQILRPFLHLIAWGGIIAIAVYPAFIKLQAAIGGRHKLALTLIVLIAIGVIVVPVWLFTTSFIEAGLGLRASVEAGTLSVAPPDDSVRGWPVVGERVYAAWSEAATSLSAFMADHQEQIRGIARTVLGNLAGAGIGALEFLISVIIAAVFLAGTEGVTAAASRLLTRVAGDHGESLRLLSVATIRSVAVGVLGIAMIQALAAGLGIALAGVPAAGLWALLVLMLAIVQLPPLLVLLPIAIYVFSIESTTVAVIFAIWAVIVSFSDTFLKPLLLGRGVDAPMLVILLGAIGGMILAGIIGLFVGAVVLSLSYKLFRLWLESAETPSPGQDGTAAETE